MRNEGAKRTGDKGELIRDVLCLLTSVHPSIHCMLGPPLCLHLKRNVQVANKKNLYLLSMEDEGQPVEDAKRNQLLLSFFSTLPETCPIPSFMLLRSQLLEPFSISAEAVGAGM